RILVLALRLQAEMPAPQARAVFFADEFKVIVLRDNVGVVFRCELGFRGQDFFEDMLPDKTRAFLSQHGRFHGKRPLEDGADFQSGIHVESVVHSLKGAPRLILTEGFVLPMAVRSHPCHDFAQRWLNCIRNGVEGDGSRIDSLRYKEKTSQRDAECKACPLQTHAYTVHAVDQEEFPLRKKGFPS